MNKKGITSRTICISLLLIAGLVAFDQGMKALAVSGLRGGNGIDLIPGILRLQYLENRGIAWGMFQNKQIIFIILTLVFLAFAIWFFLKIPTERMYGPLRVCIIFLTAGAIGNLIDRTINQFVVDFIYFSCINFPIFNVADIYVTLSVIALVFLILFHYKENDLAFLSHEKKDHESNDD